MQTCLAKDPDERWQSAADVARQLRWIADDLRRTPAEQKPEGPAPWGRRALWISVGLAVLFGAALIAVTFMRRLSPGAPEETVQFEIQVPASVTAINGLSVSPDGLLISYVGAKQLWVHDLTDLTTTFARPVAGAIVDDFSSPFWSPDGQAIAYFFSDKLWTIPAAGGIPRDICPAQGARGGSWGADGTLIFALNQNGIFRVRATGGTPVQVTTPDKSRDPSNGHMWPHFVDERRFTYNEFAGNILNIASLDAGEPRHPLATPTSEAYVASGFMLTVENFTLTVRRLASYTQEGLGEPKYLARGIRWPAGTLSGQRAFAVSATTLAYSATSPRRSRFATVDRMGQLSHGAIRDLILSAAGRWRATMKRLRSRSRMWRTTSKIWLLSLLDGRATPLTTGLGDDRYPRWSPKSDQVAFMRNGTGSQDLYIKRIGDDPEARVGESSLPVKIPHDWHQDGTLLFSKQMPPRGAHNFWLLRPDGIGKPEIWFKSEDNIGIGTGRFSPNGRWVAYRINNLDGVWVRSYPGAGNAQKISMVSAGGRRAGARTGRRSSTSTMTR